MCLPPPQPHLGKLAKTGSQRFGENSRDAQYNTLAVITSFCVKVMEWLDLERNAAILQKTDQKIAEKLRLKAAAETIGGNGELSPALKVRIATVILYCMPLLYMSPRNALPHYGDKNYRR